MTLSNHKESAKMVDVDKVITEALAPILVRIQALENQVFPKGGSGSGILIRLNEIESRLLALSEDVTDKITKIDQKNDKKINEVIRIVAELKEVVVELSSSQQIRVPLPPMTA